MPICGNVERIPLPIDPVLPQLVEALHQQSCAVLRAPTGAGKTTRVPPALLESGLAGRGRVVVLEPRRLAARAAARRMAAERSSRLGDEIGYQVRFERQYGPQTRLLVVTPGILIRMLLDDPFLETVGIVILDEFHERGLESDLALGMVRLVQQTVRPELRLVVMSATLEVEALARYLGNCPIITSASRQHPVDIRYEPRPARQPWPVAVAAAVERLLPQTSGDLLVFLPGLREIRQTVRQLEAVARQHDLLVLPLYGDLPAAQQDAALLVQPRRRVVLATNVAETSVTVEGITGVVDSGLARLLVFDPHVGLDRLQLTPISRASADQRAGRAGRTQAGICIRLWSETAHRARPEQTEPEIRRVDLAGPVLQLWCMGETDVSKFPWLDAPGTAAVQQALLHLQEFGALDNGKVTDLGCFLARLPVHPRLGRMLVEGHRWGQLNRVALAAALLSERDPFTRTLEQAAASGRPRHNTLSDVLDRVEVLEEFERTGQLESPLGIIHRQAARFILHARDQLARLVRRALKRWPQQPGALATGESASAVALRAGGESADEAVLRSLLAAFPDRLVRRREAGSRRGVMVGGRGVNLAPSSAVNESELFLGIDVDAGKTETIVRQASAVQRDWLPANRLTTSVEVAFDPTSERVMARKRVRFDDLILEETPAALPAEEQTARILAEAAAAHLPQVLPAADSPAGLYLTRLRCLGQWLPELRLPAFEESDLRALLTWLCHGCRSFADLRKADWLAALQGRLTSAQIQAIEREAPERLQVPSGSRIALRYELGRPPVLAVRIQEVFGWRNTPRIAAGRVRVLLHLLAPNFRPQQVTDDLASFWTNTYPQVRKELRARYPRHAWPEDPWNAIPEGQPRRQRPSS